LRDPDHGPLSWNTFTRRIDFLGIILLLGSSVLLAFALQVGGTPGYDWTSAKVLGPLIVSVCLLPIFVFSESRHPEPLLPLRLFRLRNYSVVIIFTLFFGAGFFALVIFLPQRMQIVNLISPIAAGVRMLPVLVLLGVLSPIAGAVVMLTKSIRPLMWFGSILAPIGAGMISTLTVNTNFAQQYGFEAITGFSLGVTITLSTMIAQFSVERADLAAATGFQSFTRQLGGLIGIAACTAILNSQVGSGLDAFSGTDSLLANATLRADITDDPVGIMGLLDPVTRLDVQEAYSGGFSKLYLAAAVWFAISALSTIILKHEMPAEIGAKKLQGDEEAQHDTSDSIRMEPRDTDGESLR